MYLYCDVLRVCNSTMTPIMTCLGVCIPFTSRLSYTSVIYSGSSDTTLPRPGFGDKHNSLNIINFLEFISDIKVNCNANNTKRKKNLQCYTSCTYEETISP
jgi:hypothetical protein